MKMLKVGFIIGGKLKIKNFQDKKMKILKFFLIILSSFFCLLTIYTVISFAEDPIHPGYPFVFDMTGKLDKIYDKKLVIDDVLVKLSSSTTYHAPDSIFTNPSAFQNRDTIGIILKNNNTREALSVWLIKKAD